MLHTHPLRRAFIRITWVYLAVLLLVGLTIGIMYREASNVVYENTIEYGQNRLDKGISELTNQLNRLCASVSGYAQLSDYQTLKQAKGSGIASQSVQILRSCDELKKLLLSQDSYVKYDYLLFRNNEIFCSSWTAALSYHSVFGTVIKAGDTHMKAEGWYSQHFDEDKDVLLLAAPSYTISNRPAARDYVLCAIKVYQGYYRNSDLLVYMLDAQELAETFLTEDMQGIAEVELVTGTGEPLFGHLTHDEGILLEANSSAYSFTARVSLPKYYFDMKLAHIMLTVRIYIIAAFIGLLLLLGVVAFYQYKPFSRALNKAMSVNAHGRNPYDYIENAISAVISAKNESERRLALTINAEKNSLLYNALRYGLYRKSELHRLDEIIGDMKEGFAVIIVRFPQGTTQDSTAQLLARLSFDCISVQEELSELMLIADVQTDSKLAAICSELPCALKQFSGAAAGISEHVWGLKSLHEAYEQALFALNNQTDDSLLSRYSVDIDVPKEERISPAVLIKLSDVILAGSVSGVNACFDEIQALLPKVSALRAHRLLQAIAMTIEYSAFTLGEERYRAPDVHFDDDPMTTLTAFIEQAEGLVTLSTARQENLKQAQQRAVVEYIQEHYADSDLCADSIASAMGLSRSGVYRCAQAILGCSMAEYIENLRIEKTQQLLLNTEMNMESIAFAAGFSAVNTMYRVFKKHCNLAPGAWREQKRAEFEQNEKSDTD